MIDCVTNIDWSVITTLITAVATIWLAAATYSTAQETIRRREQNNMPNLVIRADKKFYLYRALSGNYLYWHENNL